MRLLKRVLFAACAAGSLIAATAQAQNAPYCGDTGVWIQILGAGGHEIDDSQAGPSYLVWIDNRARLLIDTASGSAARYDEAGADFNDLDAIALTHLHASNTIDLPAFLEGSVGLGRERPLPLFGPSGSAAVHPDRVLPRGKPTPKTVGALIACSTV